MDERRRGPLDPGRRPHDARASELERALDADVPRAPRAHVLEVPLARHARPDPRRLHRRPSARVVLLAPPVRAAALPRARVRATDGPRDRALADPRRPARRPAATRRLPGDRRPPLPGGPSPATRGCTSRSRSRTSTRAIAPWFARWFYANTQSRIHVLVTHGFLRSLARLELEESAVGRFAEPRDGDGDGRRSRRSRSATRRGRSSPRSPRRRSPARLALLLARGAASRRA